MLDEVYVCTKHAFLFILLCGCILGLCFFLGGEGGG